MSIILPQGSLKPYHDPDVDTVVSGIISGDRHMLSRAITLIESQKPEHERKAHEILDRCLAKKTASIRIGITGAPGAGKSTFIESLGELIISKGLTLAVLAIDPSSRQSKGSILGDKARMEKLASRKEAYIRPTASSGYLGGTSPKTHEVIVLCEAAGYDVIMVETVGVGQSEVLVDTMVDFILLLMLPGSGDELQGIKRGIMEIADAVAITKTDGDQSGIAAINGAYRPKGVGLRSRNQIHPRAHVGRANGGVDSYRYVSRSLTRLKVCSPCISRAGIISGQK